MNRVSTWEYVWRNALMQLRNRHAGSALGPFWFLFSPLAQITIYSLVFTRIMEARIAVPGGVSLSFTIYLCAGLMPWVAFSEQIARSQTVLIQNAPFILNTALPEHLIVLRDALECYLKILLSLLLVLVFSLFLGNSISSAWLVLPAVSLLLSATGLGIGTLICVLAVFLRDLGPSLGLLLQLWFWATPIVYVPSILPEKLQQLVMWNPVYPYIRAIQQSILSGEFPGNPDWFAMGTISIASIAVGFGALRFLRYELRDVL